MLLKGGFTNYGQDIGILMLDTKFPRIPGDIGNANTYPGINVRYKIVKGADAPKIMGKNPDPSLIQPFIEAAQELETEGCKAITTSCGFLAAFQPIIQDAVSIPVFCSALILVPLVSKMISKNKVIGVLTERAQNMTDEHFQSVGWSMKDYPVVVSGMQPGSPFPGLFCENGVNEEYEVLEACIREMTERHMREHPDTGALVFECTNFGPWSKLIQRISGVPVFGINELIKYMASCVNVHDYLEDLTAYL